MPCGQPLPNQWIFGQTIGVSVDAQDHVRNIHRGGSLVPGEVHATTNPPIAQSRAPASPILEFDQAGNLIDHRGDPAKATIGWNTTMASRLITKATCGSAATAADHRIARRAQRQDAVTEGSVDPFHDNMILRFTSAGKFIMQIGKPGTAKGGNDIENLQLAAKTCRSLNQWDLRRRCLRQPPGYRFDADTGTYKRPWGAYGHKPDDR